MEYRMNKYVNKVDFNRHPSMIPNTDEGNLKLYYEFSLVRDSYEVKSKDIEDGINEPMENHVAYYMAILNEMDERGLKVTRKDRSAIEKSISKAMRDAVTTSSYFTLQFSSSPNGVTHCPHCGNKLTKEDEDSKICGECHGRQPGWSLVQGEVMKPFGSWESWESCISTMMQREGYTREVAERVCGRLKHELEKISSDVTYSKV